MLGDLEESEINHNDSVMFNNAVMQPDDERLQRIFVGDPVDMNGKIHYTVRAFDSEGEFDIKRKFSEFEALRKSFVQRLTGMYVPKLPKGSFFSDSKDIKFLQERAFHLE